MEGHTIELSCGQQGSEQVMRLDGNDDRCRDVESQSAPRFSQMALLAKGLDMVMKTVGIIAFMLSCVALWPAIASALDTKLATSLARWSSAKDFLEYCETVSHYPHRVEEQTFIDNPFSTNRNHRNVSGHTPSRFHRLQATRYW